MRAPLALGLLFLVAGCRTVGVPLAVASAGSPSDTLAVLAEDRDYPALEQATRGDASPVALAYRALALHRLGDEAGAEAAGAAALAGGLPDTLAGRTLALRVQNAARASDYAGAVRLIDAALAAGGLDSARVEGLSNERLLWEALIGAPALEASAVPGATVPLRRDAVGLRRMAAVVAGDSVHYVLDTGANLGVLAQSEAARLGLEVRPSGVLVGGVTGARVPAEVALAPVEIGGSRMEGVPFLVFPDSALAFPQIGYRIEGIIGLPVLRALGAFRLPADEGDLELLAPAPAADPPTLFLDGFTLEVRATLAFGSPRKTFPVTCILDTGATQTHILPPFYHRNTEAVEATGTAEVRGFAGAGGAARTSVWVLPEVEVTVGGATVVLSNVAAHVEGEASGAPCRLGIDVLGAQGGAVFDFGAGRLTLDAG